MKAGTVVFYRGSIPEAHGYYSVVDTDQSGRMILTPEPNWEPRPMLYQVSPQSVMEVQFAS